VRFVRLLGIPVRVAAKKKKKHRLYRAQQCSVRHSQRPKKHKWNRDNFCQQMLHSSIAELHNGQHFGITERPTADSRQKIYVV